jgi:glycerol-3-phosphate dehydrogenase
LVGNIKATAFGLSLIKVMFFKLFLLFNRACYFMCNVISRMKGFLPVPGGGIELISHAINKKLNIPIAVLMGANLAPEVADEKFCETTIGAASLENGNVLRDIIQTDYFRVVVVNDVEAVEMCGALKVRQFSRV